MTKPDRDLPTDALELALAAFARQRSGQLARSIDELGRAALVGFEPPAPRKNSEFQRSWLELASVPQARSWCLDTIIDRLPKLLDGEDHPSGDKHEALLERLLATDASLGTVEKLVHGQATGKVVAMLLPGALAGTVRSLEVNDDELWAVIAATPLPRLRELRAFGWKRKQYDKRFAEAVLPYLEQHAQITRVGCAIGMVPRFSKALTARLDRLAVRADLAHGVKLWAKLPKLRSLRCEWSSDVELVRDGKRELLRVDASTWGSRLELKGLPRSFTRIEVHGNQTFARDLAAKYSKLDVVAMPPPSGKITGVK